MEAFSEKEFQTILEDYRRESRLLETYLIHCLSRRLKEKEYHLLAQKVVGFLCLADERIDYIEKTLAEYKEKTLWIERLDDMDKQQEFLATSQNDFNKWLEQSKLLIRTYLHLQAIAVR